MGTDYGCQLRESWQPYNNGFLYVLRLPHYFAHMKAVTKDILPEELRHSRWHHPFQTYILPFFSGLLLFAAWPMSPFTILIFVALVPLLWLEQNTRSNSRFFALLYLNFFTWNVATTWWIWNASPGGAVGAIVANSLLMTIPWLLFRFTKRKLGSRIGYISLIFYWLTFEYIHHNWDLSWPWLTLGNVFATSPVWIKWYEYTGTTGGSLWVLLVNILLFTSLPVSHIVAGLNRSDKQPFEVQGLKFKVQQIKRPSFIAAVLLILIPAGLSFLIGLHKKMPFYDNNVVVVQPNIDPYNEKFSGNTTEQIAKLIRLSESQIDSNTRLVVWPETAIAAQVWEDRLLDNPYYQPVIQFVQRHPKILLVTGADSYFNFGNTDNGHYSMRHDENSGSYYENYNTAVGLDAKLQPLLYHKSKLVPGPETLPSWLSFLGKTFESLGGLSGTLGRSDSAIVFKATGNPYHPAPVVCYESIYSNYLTEYMRRGANIITIITNDGWWGETPGYKQHMAYARLRAIETGCWIARSANTGISCFISPYGEVYQPQPWNTEAAIKMRIPAATTTTYYSRHGDYLSRITWVVAAVLLIITLVKWMGQKRTKSRQPRS